MSSLLERNWTTLTLTMIEMIQVVVVYAVIGAVHPSRLISHSILHPRRLSRIQLSVVNLPESGFQEDFDLKTPLKNLKSD